MKQKLLTSTAMGALLAFGSTAYAEGVVLRGFGGVNWHGDQKLASPLFTELETSALGDAGSIYKHTDTLDGDFSFDSNAGYVLGAAIGYQWDNGLILEVEAAYRRNGLDFEGTGVQFHTGATLSSGGGVVYMYSSTDTNILDTDGHVDATSLMANAWYEFNLGNNQWKPFIGGGVGIAWVGMNVIGTKSTLSSTGDTSPGDEQLAIQGDDQGFAWQLGAGIGYEIAPGKQITLEYRYFNGPEIDTFDVVGDESVPDQPNDYDYDSHSLMVGFKFGL